MSDPITPDQARQARVKDFELAVQIAVRQINDKLGSARTHGSLYQEAPTSDVRDEVVRRFRNAGWTIAVGDTSFTISVPSVPDSALARACVDCAAEPGKQCVFDRASTGRRTGDRFHRTRYASVD